MLEIASQITLCLLIATLIGFIIGYLVAKSTSKQASPTPSSKKTEESAQEVLSVEEVAKTPSTEEEIKIPTDSIMEEANEALAALEEAVEAPQETEKEKEVLLDKPELLEAPRNNEKDALTQIKGIGPKVEEKLNEAGIFHFDQIANWTEENMLWLEAHTTFAHRAKKDLWVEQAKTLD